MRHHVNEKQTNKQTPGIFNLTRPAASSINLINNATYAHEKKKQKKNKQTQLMRALGISRSGGVCDISRWRRKISHANVGEKDQIDQIDQIDNDLDHLYPTLLL